MRKLGSVVACLVIVVFAAPTRADNERWFGAVPYFRPTVYTEQWQPLVRLLTEQAATDLRLTKSFSAMVFEDRVLQGDYDYALMDALLFQQAQKAAGYIALAQMERALTGIIVARKDTTLTVADLNNKVLVFPGPRSLGATLLTRAYLKQNGIGHQSVYVGDHEAVYTAVAEGRFPAGGGDAQSFALLPAEVRNRLRVLYTTRPVMAHVLAAHPRTPAAERGRLKQVVLALHESPAGAALLQKLELHRFVPLRPADINTLQRVTFPNRIRHLAFHVIPRFGEGTTKTEMYALATYLRQRLELYVPVRTYHDMDVFENAIYHTQTPALIYANPLQAMRLTARGFEVVAQQVPASSPEGLRGALLVRTDSPFRQLTDLRDKRIAFGGNQNAFFSHVVPKALLRQAGLSGRYVDLSKPGPVADVFPRLSAGEVDAIGVGSLMLTNKAIRDKFLGQMQVLAESAPMPGLAWLVGPNLHKDTRDEIKHLLLSTDNDELGRLAMQTAGIDRLLPADNKSYVSVRRYFEEVARR